MRFCRGSGGKGRSDCRQLYRLTIYRYRYSGGRERHRSERFLPLPQAQFHVLVALTEGDRHGYAVMQAVEESSGGIVKMGAATLYGTLKKLVDQGLAEEVPERALGGRRPAPALLPPHRARAPGLRRRSRPPGRPGPHHPHQPRPRDGVTCAALTPSIGASSASTRATSARSSPTTCFSSMPTSPPTAAYRRPAPHRPRPDRHRPPLPTGATHERENTNTTLYVAIAALAVGGALGVLTGLYPLVILLGAAVVLAVSQRSPWPGPFAPPTPMSVNVASCSPPSVPRSSPSAS